MVVANSKQAVSADGSNYRLKLLRKHTVPIICVFLTIALCSVYLQVKDHQFINLDDDLYVTENKHVLTGLSIENMKWAFNFSEKDRTYWHPFTWVSHMMDVQLWGLNAGRHHLTNLFFHIMNAVLLFLVLRGITGAVWKSAFVASVFALHPVNVETVAWVAERKNLLSTFFWFLVMLTYLRYTIRPNLMRYLLMVACFIMGLLAKPMLVTMPFVLLLLDYWPLGRINLGQSSSGGSIKHGNSEIFTLPGFLKSVVIIEKIPLILISIVFTYIPVLTLKYAETTVSFEKVPMGLRVTNALVSYIVYMEEALFPHRFAFYYPFPKVIPVWQPLGALIVLVIISVMVLFSCRRRPYLLIGWLWYVGTLVPVIGLMQAGIWPAFADRWTYVPLIGIYVMVTWGVAELVEKMRSKEIVLAALGGAVLCFLAIFTWVQTGYWKNNITLYSHALGVTKDNYVAHFNLAAALCKRGDFQGGNYHFSEVLKINPEFVPAHGGLGATLAKMGKYEEAIKQFNEVLKIDPNNVNAHYGLGFSLEQMGKYDEAIKEFSEVLKIDPNNADSYIEFATILTGKGRNDEAIKNYNKAFKNRPGYIKALVTLGNLMLSKGNYDEAVRYYLEIIDRYPHQAVVYNILGSAYINEGNLKKAIEYFQKSLREKPDYAPAVANLQTAQMNLVNFEKLLPQIQDAIKANPQNPILYTKLGDVNRLMGKYDKAAAQYQKALSIQPKYIPAMYGLVLVYSIGDYAKALDMLQRMRQIQPGNPEIYYNIARIYAKQNMTKESIGWLNQAIKKGFNNWDLLKKDPNLANIRNTAFINELLKNH